MRDADKKTFAELERDIADYAQKARNGKIKIEDLQGGTFTDFKRRRLRLALEHADPESAAERNSRHAQNHGSRRWR